MAGRDVSITIMPELGEHPVVVTSEIYSYRPTNPMLRIIVNGYNYEISIAHVPEDSREWFKDLMTSHMKEAVEREVKNAIDDHKAWLRKLINP